MLRRLPVTIGVVAAGVLGVLVVIQPWLADRRGEAALRFATDGNLAQARDAVLDSKKINPFSIEPFLELGAIEIASNDNTAALRAFQFAVQREPANPAAWSRLGQFYLYDRNQPERAIPVLRAAVYLDPYSNVARNLLVTAIRAALLQQQTQAAKQPKRAAAGAASAP